ncbi:type I restriction enzyme subunit R domain-containing protein [Escherichia coli]
MQAFSRTNRIYDATKTFGNIVTFRDLERSTIDAITLFGDKKIPKKCGVRKELCRVYGRLLLMLPLVKLSAALWQ